MANYSELLNDINAAIYENNDQEIDALEVRAILREMVTSLGSGFLFKGIATPSSPSGTGTYEPDQNVFYLATTAGTYTYLGGLVVAAGEVAFLCYDGTWTKKSSALLSTGSIVDNTTTDDATKPLSAKQGKVLADAGAATAAEVTALGQEVGAAIEGQNDEIADFEETITNQIDNYRPIVINGNVTNAPDEEDITTDENDLLKFANRGTLHGMGYMILRRDKTFAEQITLANTIYEIRYDFTLGANFTMPDGCELRFNGGSIDGDNHKLTMTRTLISGNGKFIDCDFAGTILNDSVRMSWFTNGMSNTSDYSVDHAPILISAMKLASCKIRQGWLDLERIPLCIKQTVVISNPFGNIGMKNGLFYFVSSSDRQAMFDYQQTAQYQGNYSPIVDTTFYDVGDHYDTCVIKKTSWSDTLFSYWRDIKVFGFTGYFFVTNSYVQECTFENISAEGAGMFSTNSDNLYTGGYGSGNILNFLNCNINGGAADSKTTIRALYDMSNIIEGTIHNAVLQGRIGGSNIYPLYISQPGEKRTTIVLDGFWVEYVTASVLKKIKVENSSAWIIVKRNAPVGFDVVNSNLTIRDEQSGGLSSKDLINNINIDSASNVTLIIDAATYQLDYIDTETYPNFQKLISDGVLRELQNSTPPYGASVTQTGVAITLRPVNSADLMREYINKNMTAQKVSGRNCVHKLGNSNGIPILIFENTETATYYDFSFINHYEKLLGGGYSSYVARSLWWEVIYRATVLVDVTEDNLDIVYCRGRGFLNAGGAGYADFITPTVGMQAGETTGWKRMGRASVWPSSSFTTAGSNLMIRNTRLEIAKFIIGRRNVDLTDDIFIDGDGVLQRIDKTPKQYFLPVSSANDNLAYMSPIVNDCPAIIETAKNIYKYVNGAVHAMFNPSAGTTANRPVLSATDAGFVYFDTTLNKAIIWKGAAWVNMDGTAL